MLRKVIQVGRSQAVTIPKEIAQEAHLRNGSKVDVNYKSENGEIILRPLKKAGIPKLDHKFAQALQRGLNRYKDALKVLARR